MVKALLTLGTAFYHADLPFIKDIQDLGIDLTYRISGKSDITDIIKDIDIYITGVDKIDKKVIDAAPKLKYIVKFGTGLDNIDLDYASQKGILVTNAPGQNASAVAELAFGLMLSASRNIPQSNESVKNGLWEIMLGHDLEGKTLGIIGFGTIGQKLAKRAYGFEMDILAYGQYKNDEEAKKWNVNFVELEELLASSDFIIISTSLKPSTFHLINKDNLNLMKKTAFLINISRGNIIDEDALMEVLKKNQIGGAALDVFKTEPPNLEFAQLPNVIGTPHIGGSTYECAYKIGEITVNNIRSFLKHQPLTNVVNGDLLASLKK
ncbi:phosphoglycerate dehydrogenase [Bacillus sp. 03113]|uniref:phosphoglycerate dehydrogenase n=1 Tax=Bacillus sp. 03113 TaxID=2578211 RepID=UPI0011448995|nr:phosphoglycerate dehydrogenase [Bacillus sp. 03113]